jgi:diguanylate cyclase (GGDEF)-like protein
MPKDPRDQEIARFARESPFLNKLEGVRKGQTPARPPAGSVPLQQFQAQQLSGETTSTQTAEDFEKLAFEDKLTGLRNHRAFVRALERELKRGMRYKRPVAICLVAIDGFENIRRSQGDSAADCALQAVAGAIKASIREVDLAARFSAAEFAVIFPETNASGVQVVAERIRQKARNTIIDHQYSSFYVTVSIGMASVPAHAREKDELLARAASGLDMAHSRGGDKVC